MVSVDAWHNKAGPNIGVPVIASVVREYCARGSA